MIKVIVVDRAKADVYDTATLGDRLVKTKSFANDSAHKHESALTSDAPGRVFNRSAGIHQSYGERHSVRDEATKTFVRAVARALEEEVHSTKCSGFVVAAAPRLLSQLNKEMSSAVRVKLLGQIRKDLSHEAPRALNTRLLALRRSILAAGNARLQPIEASRA